MLFGGQKAMLRYEGMQSAEPFTKHITQPLGIYPGFPS